ncbi:MAG: transcriptional regulator [Haloarculaceae archaeon]
MTTLYVTVGDRESVREEAVQFVRDAESGEVDRGDERIVLQFGSYGDLIDSLTPLRLDLLRTIVTEEPESIRETARVVDRDVSDVHSDLKHLEVLGILDLEEGGPDGAMRPVVPFDRIDMEIDYPLVEEDADDASASA